jgi:hypothetical protein
VALVVASSGQGTVDAFCRDDIGAFNSAFVADINRFDDESNLQI